MTITVIGGDARSIAASLQFYGMGYETYVYAIDKKYLREFNAENLYSDVLTCSDAAVLPLPLSQDGESVNCPLSSAEMKVIDVFHSLKDTGVVFCGKASEFHKRSASEFGLDLIDYYESEAFQINNALTTAEGAVSIFMSKKKITVWGSECAVSGYGRIGKCLADRLNKLGARVTVTARSERDLAWAKINGCSAKYINEFLEDPAQYDCIFNTIPHNIFTEDCVKKMKSDLICIELASKPYGMSAEASMILKDRYIKASSLPGKYAPITAGKIIADTVCSYL
ncbi:MAG: hypothetical protein IJS45_02225 [Clostridia bacterium]|nr:hypothetical protein [Clostridia bacterium]